MPVPPLELDTRRYADLVEEARGMIPREAPGWTDQNASDPGITLVELFAFLAEQVAYRANRTTERHRRAFLALLGCDPAPPRPARVVLAITPSAAGDGGVLPAGLAFASAGVPVRTFARLTLTSSAVAAAQAWDGRGWSDATAALRAGTPFAPFGEDGAADPAAAPGERPALVLGFDGPLPAGRPVTLHVAVDGERTGEAERARLAAPAAHHALRTVWEVHDGAGWRTLDADAGEVVDETRGLTFDGSVVLRPPVAVGLAAVGEVPTPLRQVRCRLDAGAPDDTVRLRGLAVNAVPARQAAPRRTTFTVAAGTAPPVPPLVPGTAAPLRLAFDATGAIDSFAAPGDPGPPVLVLASTPATATAPGRLTLACERVARDGDGALLDGAPIADGAVALWTAEADGAHGWQTAGDLDAAGPDDAVAIIDQESGALRFGDGRRGRRLPAGAPLLAAYEGTLGAAGRSPAATSWRLAGADDELNAALLGGDPAATQAALAQVTNPWPATGGADAEPVAHAAGRGAARLWAHERLVSLAADAQAATLDELPREAVLALDPPARAATLLDLERIALDVPGVRVARARAFGGLDGTHPGLAAPGTVTVVLVAGVPRRRPVPSRALLAAVRRHLERHKTLGTRLVVCGPEYVPIDVTATLAVVPGTRAERVRADAAERVAAHLDPLTGGPAGRGRAFGRDVFRSELLELLDGVDGVDHVAALELAGPEGGSCGNVCVPATGLAVAGETTIGVTS